MFLSGISQCELVQQCGGQLKRERVQYDARYVQDVIELLKNTLAQKVSFSERFEV